MKLLLIVAVLFSTAALAKDDCKARCSGVRGQCKIACEDPSGAGKSKKQAAECVKKMCDLVVQQCEANCGSGAGNGKHK